MSVSVVGIGMHPFGRTPGVSGRQQGICATRAALADAGVEWQDVQFAVGGSISAGYADTVVNELGLTGTPFVNVSNGCATGASALMVAVSMIDSGQADLCVAVGFDKHESGAFNADPESVGLGSWYGSTGLMLTTQFFGMKIMRYLDEHDLPVSLLAKVAAKAFRNGALNSNAWRRTPLSENDIAAAPMVSDPLTKYMFCSPGEGAVALVLASAKKAATLASRPVVLRSVVQRTRRYGSFEVFSPWLAPERADSPTVEAAAACFEDAGIGPADVDVAQIQDTEAGAEIMHMTETGLCAVGEEEKLITLGQTEIHGPRPINTDGGCIANGEPIGASGLRQIYENVLQLRGDAGTRQVGGKPRVAFTHVYGSPGVSACTLLAL
jgi:acetyl-CoA C-acetyltransferase